MRQFLTEFYCIGFYASCGFFKLLYVFITHNLYNSNNDYNTPTFYVRIKNQYICKIPSEFPTNWNKIAIQCL